MLEVALVCTPILAFLTFALLSNLEFIKATEERDFNDFVGLSLLGLFVGSIWKGIANYYWEYLGYLVLSSLITAVFLEFAGKFIGYILLWNQRDVNIKKITEQWYNDLTESFSEYGYSSHDDYLDLSMRIIFIRDELIPALLLLRAQNRKRLSSVKKRWDRYISKVKKSKRSSESLNIIENINNDIQTSNNKLSACLEYLGSISDGCEEFFYNNQASEPVDIDLKGEMDNIFEIPDILIEHMSSE
jgi:hypothetical protein